MYLFVKSEQFVIGPIVVVSDCLLTLPLEVVDVEAVNVFCILLTVVFALFAVVF